MRTGKTKHSGISQAWRKRWSFPACWWHAQRERKMRATTKWNLQHLDTTLHSSMILLDTFHVLVKPWHRPARDWDLSFCVYWNSSRGVVVTWTRRRSCWESTLTKSKFTLVQYWCNNTWTPKSSNITFCSNGCSRCPAWSNHSRTWWVSKQPSLQRNSMEIISWGSKIQPKQIAASDVVTSYLINPSHPLRNKNYL